MSDSTPPGTPPGPSGPSGPPPGVGVPPGPPPATAETLQAGGGDRIPAANGRGRRRPALIIGGAVLVGALAGGGAWAWTAWFSQGPQPSETLPAGTLAYVSVDLDPSGGQKVEALKTLRKFPAFKDEIGLDTDDDLREAIFEEIQKEGGCDKLDFEDDIDSWVGNRVALAAIDRGDDGVAPVLVVQTKGEEAAEKGVKKLVDCVQEDASDDFGGYAFNGDWVVLAETEEIAEDVVSDAGKKTLAADATYKKWTEAAGDPGIMTMYAAPEAGAALLEFAEDELPFLLGMAGLGAGIEEGFAEGFEEELEGEFEGDVEQFEGELPSDFPSDLTEEEFQEHLDELLTEPKQELETEIPDEMRKAFEDFPGVAGTVRFDDGALEIELAGGEMSGSYGSFFGAGTGLDVIRTLPETTAAAFGAGFEKGWVEAVIDQMAPIIEDESGMDVDDAIAELEEATGLSVPEDIEALGGESFAIAFDSEFDASAFEEEDFTRIPVGIKIKGDTDRIEESLDKIRDTLGPDGELLLSRSADGHVLVSASEDYLDKLEDEDGLGGTSTFEDLVPDEGDASAVFFVDFDADDWLAQLVEDLGAPDEIVDNVKPLGSLGVSGWTDGEESHSLFKLTTD